MKWALWGQMKVKERSYKWDWEGKLTNKDKKTNFLWPLFFDIFFVFFLEMKKK